MCELCATALGPHQQLLAGTLAAAAQPPVQDSPDAISLRAWVNPPWTTALDQVGCMEAAEERRAIGV